MPEQASLFRSGVPFHSPLERHLLWDLALITPGLARSSLFYFSLQSACSAHATQLQLDPSSRTQVYKDIKVGYEREPYIQQQTFKADRSTILHRILLAQHRDQQASRHYQGKQNLSIVQLSSCHG